MVGVGFLYKYGYFDQVIAGDGEQVAQYKQNEINNIPVTQVTEESGVPLTLRVPCQRPYRIQLRWRVDVRAKSCSLPT